jgi:hypothetical protein
VRLMRTVAAPMLRLRPSTVKAAMAYVREHHRHLPRVVGGLYAVAVADSEIRGVAITGRPNARMSQTGWRAEVTRVATDQSRNAYSMLYGASERAAKALGYCEIITYTLPEEGGASLRASNWEDMGLAGGGEWNCATRPRAAAIRPEIKRKWRRRLCAGCVVCGQSEVA